MNSSSNFDPESVTALIRLMPKSRLTKQFRKLQLERLFIDFIVENERYPGSAELAKALDVTPRTIRNYLRERRERLHGAAKIWLYLHHENGKQSGAPEFLTIEECAPRLGLSVREVRRKIWEQRRDFVATVRQQFKTDHKTTKEQKLELRQGEAEDTIRPDRTKVPLRSE